MTEKVKKRRNTVYLPEDLLVDILSRVPQASLARFRSTSKGWNSCNTREGKEGLGSWVDEMDGRWVDLIGKDETGWEDGEDGRLASPFYPN
ncbi:hypothetical protein DY000_02049504 [Brassica cretica]|uniref:F-box domain-containing protein n=1 Tax=Brassica cretica TaxID=69181 RepID=A0ABQ7EYP3_BRACR|nr:hypothetical protein DY000_02049504 [Brassica cretica]